MELLFAAVTQTHSHRLTGLLFFCTVVQSDPQLVRCWAEMGQAGWGEDEVEVRTERGRMEGRRVSGCRKERGMVEGEVGDCGIVGQI